MAKELYIGDVDRIRGMGKTFGEIGDVLNKVATTMQALIDILDGLAFVGAVGGLAVKHYIEVLKPPIEAMAKKCAELNEDLNKSMDAYQKDDEAGARLFYGTTRFY